VACHSFIPCQTHFMTGASRIVLDVGGQRFATSRETLLWLEGTFFSAMLGTPGRWTPETDGSYFIDRDPTHFGAILNYLRDQKAVNLVQLAYGRTRELLLAELDFYLIPLHLPKFMEPLALYAQGADDANIITKIDYGGFWNAAALSADPVHEAQLVLSSRFRSGSRSDHSVSLASPLPHSAFAERFGARWTGASPAPSTQRKELRSLRLVS